jgi:predicted MFS family arabinose efflux permease
MLVWGWRVPFLIAVITLIAAIVLRYNMPESQEVSATGCRYCCTRLLLHARLCIVLTMLDRGVAVLSSLTAIAR